MPKRRMLKVLPDPQPKPGVAYAVQVTAVEPLNDTLRVTVRHVSHEMDGFTRTFAFRLPLTPSSLAAGLFRAAGMHTMEVDAAVDPQSIVGATLAVRFATFPGNPQPQPVAFEPVKKEEMHA